MSTKSTVKSEALNDVKSLISGIPEFLPQLIQIQEGQAVEVTYHEKTKQVRMHGSERTPVNRGVFRFSDTPYEVGMNEDDEGGVELVYDSWVSNNLLGKRVNGVNKKTQQVNKEPANVKVCQTYARAKQQAKAAGRGRMRTKEVDGQLVAFVPA